MTFMGNSVICRHDIVPGTCLFCLQNKIVNVDGEKVKLQVNSIIIIIIGPTVIIIGLPYYLVNEDRDIGLNAY